MPRMPSNSDGSALFSHLGSVPITLGLAAVVLAAIVLLALLRHLFASVNVSAGTH